MNYELNRLGIDALNTMQQDMLQTARKGASVVLLSPTGSGKTLAYLLPLLEKLDAKNDDLQALVIVPSRELATQTADVARRLCSELRVCACYGGRPAMEEHQLLKGLRPHLVAATPGRLLDHLQKGNLLADNVQTLVIDEFDKVELRVGEVIACERVKKAKKLLVSQIKIGSEVRQIVSGIAKFYSPEDMVGKTVVLVNNFAPRKMAGQVSEGMLLCAEDPDGSVRLLTVDGDVAPGSEIG